MITIIACSFQNIVMFYDSMRIYYFTFVKIMQCRISEQIKGYRFGTYLKDNDKIIWTNDHGGITCNLYML